MATDARPLPDHSLDGGQCSPGGEADKAIAVHQGDNKCPDRAGATEIIQITGPSLRECTLGDDERPVLFPVPMMLCMVNDWWPSSFHCRRDSIGDDFQDYWDYQPHEHAVTYRGQ